MGHRQTPGVRTVKTGVTALLLTAAVIGLFSPDGALVSGWPGLAAFLIVIGLAFTVVADWLLAPIDNSRTFVWGLAFFLAGYLLYGVAFLAATVGGAGWGALAGGGPAAVYLGAAAAGVAQYRTLRKLPKELRIPVMAYMVVVSNLLAAGVVYALSPVDGAAGGAAPGMGIPLRASLVLLGVTMIYLSDSLIAHNLFRRPLKAPQLSIMPTYYLGQIAVVLALLL